MCRRQLYSAMYAPRRTFRMTAKAMLAIPPQQQMSLDASGSGRRSPQRADATGPASLPTSFSMTLPASRASPHGAPPSSCHSSPGNSRDVHDDVDVNSARGSVVSSASRVPPHASVQLADAPVLPAGRGGWWRAAWRSRQRSTLVTKAHSRNRSTATDEKK